MSRPKITLPEAGHRTLKKAAAQRRTTISQPIEASVAFGGVGSRAVALDLARRARARSKRSDEQAMASALQHVKDARHGR